MVNIIKSIPKEIGTIEDPKDILFYEQAIEQSGCNIWIKTSGNSKILILQSGDAAPFWEILHSLKEA